MPARYLSACLCFKNAASYLAEWLAFYSCLGVEHVYLYNNESTDDFRPLIAPYLSRGRATLIDYPGQAVQQDIYAHCLRTHGATSRWLMFCDDDEFLFPIRDIALPEALAPYERFAGVAICWMLYGTSGHERRPSGLTVENYIRRFPGPDNHVKCIVDPARISRPLLIAHQFETLGGQVIVDEHGAPMTGPMREQPSADILRINHYLTKSREEMIERRTRIQADNGRVSRLSLETWSELNETWNLTEDPIAARYGARVRNAISAI